MKSGCKVGGQVEEMKIGGNLILHLRYKNIELMAEQTIVNSWMTPKKQKVPWLYCVSTGNSYIVKIS
jgi:hypothetical protein